jgi:(2R)-3-sulfolactate dehydrogenase (NADP+)
MTGANWSLDAPSISEGRLSPGTGLFVLAIEPRAFGPGFEDRLSAQAGRLEAEGVHIPGRAKAAARRRSVSEGIEVPADVVERIRSYLHPNGVSPVSSGC